MGKRVQGLATVVRELWKDRSRRRFVLTFVAVLLAAILAAEIGIVTVAALWEWLMATPGFAPLPEWKLRLAALVVAALIAFAVLYRLIGAVRSETARRLASSSGKTDTKNVQGAVWLFILLLLAESFAAESLIKLAELGPLGGGTLAVALLLLFAVLALALLLLADRVLTRVRKTLVRFVNKLEEPGSLRETERRPASWPAEALICALSTPAKRLQEDDCARLHGYARFLDETAPALRRFDFFADPADTLRDLNRKAGSAAGFVEGFNWRQIALAYREQLRDDALAPDHLPRLILLCSEESAGFVEQFQQFFGWLLEPIAREHPGFAPLSKLEVHEPMVDFEKLASIEPELRAVYEGACARHGDGKVFIDITGGQRPWALAALEATLGSDARHFTYVAQARHAGGWIRYYNVAAIEESTNDPVSEAGAG